MRTQQKRSQQWGEVRREGSLRQTNAGNTWILGFQPTEPQENTFLSLQQPKLWCSVTAVLANTQEFSSRAENLGVLLGSPLPCTSICCQPAFYFQTSRESVPSDPAPNLHSLLLTRTAAPHHLTPGHCSNLWDSLSCLQNHSLRHLSAIWIIISRFQIPSLFSLTQKPSIAPLYH